MLQYKVVYKKYKIINGKRYGPYLYESKRVGEKVVTEYVGIAKENSSKKYFLPFIIGFLLVAGVLFFVFSNFSPTGKVALEFESEHSEGGVLAGGMNLVLKEGELVPEDARVVFSLDEQQKEMRLSELVSEKSVQGDFFVEGSSVSGSGKGYGLSGAGQVLYPEVDFSLGVYNSDISADIENESASDGGGSGSDDSEGVELIVPDASVEPDGLVVPNESPDVSGSEDLAPSAPAESEESSSESPSESSADVGALTGSVIAENQQIISGKVSKENDFVYSLNEGQSAEIVSGSVKFEGVVIGDEEVELNIEAGVVRVSTDFEYVRGGFGEEYLGSGELKLEIDLSKVGLEAEEGVLGARIIYGDAEIASVEKEISFVEVSEPVNEEANESGNLSLPIMPQANVTLNESSVSSNLSFIKDISTIRIAMNSFAEINLSEHFLGAERYSLNASNVRYSVSGEVMRIEPENEFKGTSRGKINAYFGDEITESNEFFILVSSGKVNIETMRSKIVLGEKVKWVKNVSLDDPEDLILELPGQAENISVRAFENGKEKKSDFELKEKEKKDEKKDKSDATTGITGQTISEFKSEGWIEKILRKIVSVFTGRAVIEVNVSGEVQNNLSEVSATEAISYEEILEVVLSDNSTNYVVEYYTDAPNSVEINIGKNKRVTISGPDGLNYIDVLSFTNITEIYSVDEQERIKVYWVENKSYVEFDAYDLDGNEKLDYIEWNTEHLSSQTFNIILITKAEHLDENRTYIEDVYEYVSARDDNWTTIPSEHYVRVSFEQNLTRDRDITLYARGENATIEVYRENGNVTIVEFENVSKAGWYKVYLSSLQENESYDVFDLRSSGNVEYDYIVDPASTYNISFVSPTPSNGASQAETNVQINVSIANAPDLSNLTYNWNGTNYSMYDNSLMLMYNFENLSVLEENATHVKDLSKYGNNGTIYSTVLNNSGRFGNAYQFDGSSSYVSVPHTISVPYNNNELTMSAWVKFNSLPSGEVVIIRKDNQWQLGFSSSTLIRNLISTSGITGWTVGNDETFVLSTDVWYLAAFTWNGTVLKHYMDGRQIGTDKSVTGNIAGTTSDIGIGANTGGGSLRVNGSIDEVRIWNRSMSAQEMYQQYASNLQKYNSTQWYLYVNQSQNSTIGLSNGTFTYQSFASDTSGNSNQTEQRTITIGGDTTPPSINFTSSTPANASTQFASNVVVNVSIVESNLGNLTYNWNGTNYSMYDDSLVLMYNFDNRSSLGESATIVKDLSKYGNDGTTTNSPYWNSTGKYGGGFSFNAAGNPYITIGSNIASTVNYTFSAWVRIAGSASLGGYNRLLFKGSWDGFRINPTGFWMGGCLSFLASDGDTIGTDWAHVVFVKADDKLTYYKNGNSVYQHTLASACSVDWSSAVINTAASEDFNGSIDEYRLWNRSLSASEVYQLYASNLQKYNSTQWYLYVNQSKNATDGLSDGAYTYQAFADDTGGRTNMSEKRTVTIAGTNCSLGCFFVKNSLNVNVTIVDKDGNMDLRGRITEGSIGTPDGRDFVVKNAAGNTVAWIDDVTGSLRLAGTLTQNTGTTACTAPSKSFIVKNRTGSCVAYIDSSGNAVFLGGVRTYVTI